MNTPPDFMLDFLYAVESTVLLHRKNYIRLNDKDVEWVYNKMASYYSILSTIKEIDEPLASTEVKQILLDELLNLIDDREEVGYDKLVVNNPDCKIGNNRIPSLPKFYFISFKRLSKSVIKWRKLNGKVGYLNYLLEFVREDPIHHNEE